MFVYVYVWVRERVTTKEIKLRGGTWRCIMTRMDACDRLSVDGCDRLATASYALVFRGQPAWPSSAYRSVPMNPQEDF